MQISMSETEYCKLSIDYEAGPEQINTKKDEIMSHFKKRNVKGFRPGRATNEAISFHFKKEIENSLKQELANEAFQNVISEKNIKPFGYPTFTALNLENNKFTCSFTLHKRPEFEIGTYKNFEIPKPNLPNTEELTQKIVQELRMKHGKTIPYTENDFIQMGDQIIINCKSTVDNQSIDKLTFEGQILQVGRINIPGFSENILGMQCNDTREFELNVPEIYGENTVGKMVKFEIKLLMGSKMEPASLDDDLAKIVGFDTVNALIENARSVASSRINDIEKEQINDQISKRLIENHTFEIPHWIASAEAKVNIQYSKLEWNNLSDEEKEKAIENAANNVKLSMILEKVREIEPEAQLTQEEMLGIAKHNISQFTKEPEKVFEELLRNNSLPIFLNRIKDEYALEFVRKTCTITE